MPRKPVRRLAAAVLALCLVSLPRPGAAAPPLRAAVREESPDRVRGWMASLWHLLAQFWDQAGADLDPDGKLPPPVRR